MTVTIIGVTERGAPRAPRRSKGALPIKGFASASEKVAWYGKR